jgi:hypothetical protein
VAVGVAVNIEVGVAVGFSLSSCCHSAIADVTAGISPQTPPSPVASSTAAFSGKDATADEYYRVTHSSSSVGSSSWKLFFLAAFRLLVLFVLDFSIRAPPAPPALSPGPAPPALAPPPLPFHSSYLEQHWIVISTCTSIALE